MVIREIQESDAQKLIDLIVQLDQETKFMLMEPGERNTDVNISTERIKQIRNKDNHNQFVVEVNQKLVGFLLALGGISQRTRHRAHIVIGILNEFQSQGIGTKLFETLEDWAKKSGIRRMNLTSMVNNEKGIALYKKMGFEIEGTMKDSILVDGKYIDEYSMTKLI